MSAKGQKRTSRVLFDHLVDEGEQPARNLDTECFRGFEIDNKFKFGWLQYG